LFKSGLIDHQLRLRVGQLLGHVPAHVVTDRLGISHRPAQQMLHAARLASPACSAIVPQFVCGNRANSPPTNPAARRRGSTRANQPATRPINTS
jgi:hypothetical protein